MKNIYLLLKNTEIGVQLNINFLDIKTQNNFVNIICYKPNSD